MNINFGRYKGSFVFVPGYTFRPTKAIVKIALFNIIGDSIIGSSFLDLFSGSGAVGLEAISRGAENLIFVDQNPLAKKAILKSFSNFTDCNSRVSVFSSNVLSFLKKHSLKAFDFIFADPPYDFRYYDCYFEALFLSSLANSRTIIILEHLFYHKLNFSDDFLLVDERNYGNTSLKFFTLKS